MADVPYLESGDSPTAVEMNLLFAEFDAKLSVAYDNKSFILERNSFGNRAFPMGKTFFFCNDFTNTKTLSRFGSTWQGLKNYDQTNFDAACNSLSEDVRLTPSRDDGQRLIHLAGNPVASYYTAAGVAFDAFHSLWDYNLVLVKKSVSGMSYTPIFNAYETIGGSISGYKKPEIQNRFESVEIIVENYGSTLTLPTGLKYRFFRIHNLQNMELIVNFPGGSAISIPRFGCKCARFDYGGDALTEGFNYFHRFESGDPRAFDRGSSNNITSPACISQIVNTLKDFGSGVKLLLDVRKFWNASAHFSDPTLTSKWSVAPTLKPGQTGGVLPVLEDTACIGDFLIHRGKLKIIDRTALTVSDLNFYGFNEFISDAPSAGITVSTGTSYKLTATNKDLLGVTSNLAFSTRGVPAFAVSSGGTVMERISVGEKPSAFLQLVSNIIIHAASPFIFRTRLCNASFTADDPFSGGFLTVDSNVLSAKSYNLGGDPSLNGTNQTTSSSILSDLNLSLFGLGPWLTWNQLLTMERPAASIVSFILPTSSGWIRSGHSLNRIQQSRIKLEGFDQWPTISEPIFQTPKVKEFYSQNRIGFYTSTATGTILSPQIPSLGTRFFVFDLFGDESYFFDAGTIQDDDFKKISGAAMVSMSYLRRISNSPSPDDALIDSWINQQPFSYPDPVLGTGTTPDAKRSTQITNSPSMIGWWNNHRGNIFEGNLTNGMRTYMRFPLCIESYNNLASLVNAIMRVRPITILDFFDSINPTPPGLKPFGLGVFGTGLYGTAVYPRDFFVQADEGNILEYSRYGVSPFTSSSLPSFIRNEFPYASSSDEKKYRFERAFPEFIRFGNGDFKWFSVAQVKGIADSLGFKFHYSFMGVPCSFDQSGPDLNTVEDLSLTDFVKQPMDGIVGNFRLKSDEGPNSYPAITHYTYPGVPRSNNDPCYKSFIIQVYGSSESGYILSPSESLEISSSGFQINTTSIISESPTANALVDGETILIAESGPKTVAHQILLSFGDTIEV